jgi:transposase
MRLKMERDKDHFRHLLLYCFDSKKTAAEAHRFISETYSKHAPSVKTCEYWYRRFKSGDFDLKDKERSGQPKKFENAELQALLDENSAQTLEELAKALKVDKSTVSDRLHAMGKIQKEGKCV